MSDTPKALTLEEILEREEQLIRAQTKSAERLEKLHKALGKEIETVFYTTALQRALKETTANTIGGGR